MVFFQLLEVFEMCQQSWYLHVFEEIWLPSKCIVDLSNRSWNVDRISSFGISFKGWEIIHKLPRDCIFNQLLRFAQIFERWTISLPSYRIVAWFILYQSFPETIPLKPWILKTIFRSLSAAEALLRCFNECKNVTSNCIS